MARVLAAILAVLMLTSCTGGGTPAPAPSDAQSPQPTNAPTASSEPLRVTVMTYNVLGGSPPRKWFPQIDPSELDPMVREPATVALVEHVDADIIGLQEYRPMLDAGKQMVTDLSQYTWVTPDASAGREAVAIPILYRTSRFEELDSGKEMVTKIGDGERGWTGSSTGSSCSTATADTASSSSTITATTGRPRRWPLCGQPRSTVCWS